MSSKKISFVLASVLLLSSCNLFKKGEGDSKNDLPVINLDTVQAFAAPPEPENYQASETRVNDILHTKLDVSFDWTKQYMFGKATITLKPYFYPTSTLVLDAPSISITSMALPESISRQLEQVKQGDDDVPCSQFSAFAKRRNCASSSFFTRHFT